MRIHSFLKSAMWRTAMVITALCMISVGSPAYAQGWRYGVGTGMTFLNIQGDQGANIIGYGPVQFELDLDPDQVSDLLETAFGLGGFASNGKWMITYAGGVVKLGGEGSGDITAAFGGGTFTYDMVLEVTMAKLTVGNTVYRSQNKKFAFTPYVGVRYMKHDISADYSFTQGASTTYIFRGRDFSWTDALVGLGLGYAMTPKLRWAASGDAGFGGSNGTFYFTTNLSYTVGRHFSFGPNFSYTAIGYENNEIGDAGWYLYDANEFGGGIGLAVTF